MNRFAFTIAAALALALPTLGGCAGGKYDKDLRLYLGSDQTQAWYSVPASGWYVLGVRLPGRRFQHLGHRFPAEPGERLELRRDGDHIYASAAGMHLPGETVPPETIYVAWARENDQPHSLNQVGAVDVEFNVLDSIFDSFFDDDDDRRDRGDPEKDRGARYSRSKRPDARQRMRDD